MADPKSFNLSPEIHGYLLDHSTPIDEIQQALIDETVALGGISIMQISPEQGSFMTMFTRLIGARDAVEIGTFTGYSSLAIARGLPADGHLLCCDVSEEWTDTARRYWDRAGVADRITLEIGPAAETLAALPEGEQFDLAFIDADKPGYIEYYEQIVKRLRPNGVILVDNVLFHGSVIDPEARDDSAQGIRDFNDHVIADPRVECVMLAIGDGLTFIRRRD
jgi:caffeoyl-CoA O-methyltransferase